MREVERLSEFADKGGGVQKRENFADVLYVWFVRSFGTFLNFLFPSTEVVPKLVPLLQAVLHPKF